MVCYFIIIMLVLKALDSKMKIVHKLLLETCLVIPSLAAAAFPKTTKHCSFTNLRC